MCCLLGNITIPSCYENKAEMLCYVGLRSADHSFFGTEWQKRWCALSHHIFYYYGSEKGMSLPVHRKSCPSIFMDCFPGFSQ